MADGKSSKTKELSRKSKTPLFMAIFACFLGVIMGFYAVYSGLILPAESASDSMESEIRFEDLADVAFIPIDQIIVNLRPGSSNKHLSFRSQLEVPRTYQDDVEHLLPRIIDVMNGYLSALETEDFESPAIIIRLRSQLLRRIQVVTGLGRVKDLLVMEFVLN